MNSNELPFLSATELAELIRTRGVSPVEATEAYLSRIEQVDPSLNAYITVTADRARAEARQAEAEIATGHYRGPLHGVPVAVKDQFCTEGVLTTGGSSILGEYVPDYDATVMARLKEAGAVLLGKLNMSEFAMGDAFHHPYGRPRNPWDLSRNPGTSSSGSGAATAAFLCATSLGEDTAGSIRGPAAFCGLVGIRPTWGLVSRYGMLASTWSMDAAGPISRTVRDCAISLQAIAGYDPNDSYTRDAPVPNFPNARYFAPALDWRHFTQPDVLDTAPQVKENVVPLHEMGLLELIEGEHAVTEEITALPAPGHTPGHQVIAVTSQGETAFIVGDLLHAKEQIENPDWCAGVDTDKAASAASREAVLSRAEGEGVVVAAGHFHPGVSYGRVVRQQGRRYWQPL